MLSRAKQKELRQLFESPMSAKQVARMVGVSSDVVSYWWAKQFSREARRARAEQIWTQQAKKIGTANRKPTALCAVSTCTEIKRYAKTGFCPKHQQRYKKHGDPSIGAKPLEAVSPGHVDKRGYRVVWVRRAGKSKPCLEHRHVMTTILGRPLKRHEHVHHRNGERSDNRPENLELWSTSHPAGQRAEDLVTWARAFIAEYAGQEL